MPIVLPTQREINHWLQSQRHGVIETATPVSGGSICDNYHLRTTSGDGFFVKTNRGGPADLFRCEASGLAALAQYTSLRTPRIYHVDEKWLLLEYIAPGAPGDTFWQQLAEGLAQLHGAAQQQFGFSTDNYCGTTSQPNPACENGHTFFGEQRLLYQGKLAARAGLLPRADLAQLEQLIARLPALIPQQPPALIHGDLWSGNIHCDDSGRPVLIDPAAHCSWREADIAMTRLFGALPSAFYRHYKQLLPMAPGWEQRMGLYNLYHLLNHLNLFGGCYLSQVRAVMQRYL